LHTSTFNTQYSQVSTRNDLLFLLGQHALFSTSAANLFNPSVQSSIFVGFQQQLLNGFGRSVNTRNIRIAKNNRKNRGLGLHPAGHHYRTNTITAYWELVFARENVKVQQQAVTVAQKLYNDNKKQLEIGTMAPLDVTRAESELATDRQNLIVAQTVHLQNQQILKNAISKNPLAPNLVNVEIIPTELPSRPEAIEAPSFEEAAKEAFAKRPELQEEALNLLNGEIDLKATRNALLPTATLSAQYGTVGLAGNQPTLGTPVNDSGIAIDRFERQSRKRFHSLDDTARYRCISGRLWRRHELGLSQQFPDYQVSLNVQIPIRNRSAQADNQRAILFQHQLEAQLQLLKNSALLDVRNTYIALTQDRAQVDAASKAANCSSRRLMRSRKSISSAHRPFTSHSDATRPNQRPGYGTARVGKPRRSQGQLRARRRTYSRSQSRHHRRCQDRRSRARDAHSGTLHGQVVGTEKLSFNAGQK